MSYVFDTISGIWAKHVRASVVRDKGEMFAMNFEAALESLHDANHRLNDAVNHDPEVNRAVRELTEQVKVMEGAAGGKVPACPKCGCPLVADGEKAWVCESYCKERWVL